MRDSRKARAQQKALKKPFLVFTLIVSILCLSVVVFIQSTAFTRILKKVAVKYVPRDLGIDADFDSLSVGLFPPGISLKQPKVTLREKNALDLPAGSHVEAERIDLRFRPFQMLSGNIQVHQVAIVRGNVDLAFDRLNSVKDRKKRNFSWDELFKIRAQTVTLEDTTVQLSFRDPALSARFIAERVSIAQSLTNQSALTRAKKRGYEIEVSLRNIDASLPPEWNIRLPATLDLIRLTGELTPGGLAVEELTLGRKGVELNSKGTITGDFLEPKGLIAQGEVRLQGDLAQMLEYTETPSRLDHAPTGKVVFKGKMKGDLQRFEETLRAEGSLSGEGIRYGYYEADRVESEGSWISSVGGGEINVRNATLTSKPRDRVGGLQPGSGGKIQVGAFKYRVGSSQPLQVGLKLEQAHLHWLGAAALGSIYALDARFTGPAEFSITPSKKDWSIGAKVDWQIDNFQLDNQRLGKTTPMTRILKIPGFKVKGAFIVDSRNFRPTGLTAQVNETLIDVTGKVDYKTGFDLTGKGRVNLKDIGEIAETKVLGEGSLITHVHGPASAVVIDFDAELKNASYLRLALGEFKGRIAWDDGLNQVLFQKIRAKKNGTTYDVNGAIDLAGSSRIGLDVAVPAGGDIQDFLQVFDELTREISWIPRSLNGPMSGAMRIAGGLRMDELVITAQVKGQNWEYLGEKFKAVNLDGGYDRGRYHVTTFTGLKRTGLLSGHISYDEKKKIDWELKSENFSLSDLDHIARLDVPMRGRIQISSKGQGGEGAIESHTSLGITELVVRGISLPPSDLLVRSRHGVAEIKGSGLGGQGTLQGTYDFKVGGLSSFRTRFRHFDFSPLLLLINSKLIQDRALAGLVSGDFDLDFRSGSIEEGSGHAELTEYQLSKSGVKFRLVNPVRFQIDRGTFNLENLSLQGSYGQARLDLSGRRGELDGAVSGELDLSIIEFFTSAVSQNLGAAALDFTIGGSLKAPEVEGEARLSGAVIRIPAVESAFENVMGKISLRQNVITFKELEADLASGRVLANGRVEIFSDRFPLIALNGTVSGSKLKVFPFQVAKVRGNINVHGSEIPYMIDGNVTIDSAISREKVFNQQGGRGLKTASYTPPASAASRSDYPLFRLNLNVQAPGNILVQNELFDAELKGDLAVVNTLEAPRLLGTASIVQGKMTFKDRIFQIQSSQVEFDNPTVLNPKFSMIATTEVNNRKIQLYATGRLDKYKIDLSSNPVMPETEILSLLALGITSDDARKLRTGDRSAYEQGEAASLLLHSLDFNRDVKNKTGFQIELDEVVNDQAGTSIFRPSTTAENAAAPKIVIKRQLGKRVDLSVGSTVGVGSANQKQVAAEVRVTPAFSVLGVWEDFESVDSKDDRRSYGVDLKVQKRFK